MRRPPPRPSLRLVALACAATLAAALAQAAPMDIDLPAQPLPDALKALARATGSSIAADSALLAGKAAPAVRGRLEPGEALTRLLAGSGLEAVAQPQGGWRLRPATTRTATLAEVQVIADASRAPLAPASLHRHMPAGALGSRAQLDTPFSTTVITSEQLEERAVTSLSDAFALDPSVTTESSNFTMFAPQLSTRGLSLDAGTSYKINGLPIYGQSLDIPFDHLDSVQLLKGAAGFMNGFGAPGGIVNFVTRKPGPEAVRSVDVGYRSDSIWSVHADIGSSFTQEDRFGLRINATHEEGSNYYPDGKVRRDSLSAALAARFTPDLTGSLDLVYSDRHASGESNAPFLANTYNEGRLPAPVSARDYHMATGGTYHDSRLTLATAGLTWQMAAGWTLSGKYGRSTVLGNAMRDFNDLLNSGGDYSAMLLGGISKFNYSSGEILLEGHFKTGALGHHLVLGAEQQQLKANGGMNSYPWSSNGRGNFHEPFPNTYTGGKLDPGGWYRSTEYDRSSFFVSDTLTLGNWSLIAGLRYNDYEQQGFSKATGAVISSYKKNGTLTPTAALLYKPTRNATLYASYVEALESGGVVGNQYRNAGDVLEPLKSKQYEVGLKIDAEAWNTTAALFRAERGSAYGNSDGYYVQEGLAVLQGLELNASVRPTRAWTLGGGLMLLDAKYRRGTPYDGNRIAGSYRTSATAYARYEVPQAPGLALHANVKYIGDSYVRPANPVPTSSRTVVGAGASYLTRIAGYPVTWRAEISNLFDRKVWLSYGNQIGPLAPRTFALNAKMEF